MVVIHNGLSSLMLHLLRANSPTLRLGIVGQIGPWKGHDDLLDATRLALGARVQVLLCASSAQVPQLMLTRSKQRVTELNLQDQVEWCGVVEKPIRNL